MSTDLLQLRQPQSQRLARFGAATSVDLHCHCLPGLDDGPADLAAAVAMCQALVADGVTHVIATPHQRGPYEQNHAADVRAAVTLLREQLALLNLPLDVRAGAEIRVDGRTIDGLDSGELLTLDDAGLYVLVELPHSTLLDLRPLIERLVDRGMVPIIAHPERHAHLNRSPQLLAPWVAGGAVLQVTAGSLLGVFGASALQSAWQMIDAGWVSMIASDAHDVSLRPPAMTAAIDAIAARSGHAVARRLCIQHPQAVLEGRAFPRPVVRRNAGARR